MAVILYILWLFLETFALKGSGEERLTPCPDTWTAYRGSCYLFVVGHTTGFFEAEYFCRSHGGHLVHVETASENSFLKDHIRKNTGENYWLGLTDESVEGVWKWFDTHTKPTFTDWHTGEPSDSNRHEDCAHFWNRTDFDFEWNDTSCEDMLEPLCEIRGNKTTGIIG